MILTAKKITTLFFLIIFLSVIFFGLSIVTHNLDENMTKGCPFPSFKMFVCPQNILISTIHHLSEYNSFLNVPITYNLVFLIIFSIAIYIFKHDRDLFLPKFQQWVIYLHNPQVIFSDNQKILRWLSFFENSPSLF